MSEAEKAMQTRTLQIIVFALMMGVVSFGVIVLFIGGGDQPAQPAGDQDFFFYLAFAMAIAAASGRYAISGIMVKAGLINLQKSTEGMQELKLWELFKTKTIIASAIPEGACFFCLIAVMLTGNISLLFLVAGLLLLMILGFPTRTRIEHWVEARMAELEMKQ